MTDAPNQALERTADRDRVTMNTSKVRDRAPLCKIRRYRPLVAA